VSGESGGPTTPGGSGPTPDDKGRGRRKNGDQEGRSGGSNRQADGKKQDGGQGRSRSRRGRRRGGRRRGGARRGEQKARAAESRREPPRPGTLVTLLARAGLGSRRRCDEMIRAGRVTVNGESVDFPRHKVSPDDTVAVDGEVVDAQPLRYVLLDKPRGVASTRSDPHAERPIVDLVPEGRTLFPVGRLDVETTGLIILTNDGPLAHRLMHPRYGVPKCYRVRVRGRVGRKALAALRKGVELEDGMTAPAEVRLVKQGNKTALVELTIHQGRKRQVRRMFAALGMQVEELHRKRYGPLSDEGLKVGAWRDLSADEIDALQRAAEHVDERVGQEPTEEAVPLAESAPGAGPGATVSGEAGAATDGDLGASGPGGAETPGGEEPGGTAAGDAPGDAEGEQADA